MNFKQRMFIANFFLFTVVLSGTLQLNQDKYNVVEQVQAVELGATDEEITPQTGQTLATTPITPELTEKGQIIAYIVEVFGDDAAEAITIARGCENKALNPRAENWNRNGTWDAGVLQINQVHGYSMEDMKDYKKNIDAAYKIFKRSGWSAWSCSELVGVTPFWKK